MINIEVVVNSQIKGIDWTAKGTQRITQNVLNLINTYKYEIAYNRVLGLSASLVDKPSNYTIQMLQSEIFELVSRFEPRATVKDVEIFANELGDITVKVVIDI